MTRVKCAKKQHNLFISEERTKYETKLNNKYLQGLKDFWLVIIYDTCFYKDIL